MISGTFFRIQFYHTKKCEGTTTQMGKRYKVLLFYHTKKCEGTTTQKQNAFISKGFYHTKKCEGTTTMLLMAASLSVVLPYQEMRGNYNYR